MQGKGDPRSPTQAENGQAGMFVPQVLMAKEKDLGSPGKGGNVSGLGKGFGGKMLLEETWPLPRLGAWQNRLRSEVPKLWFPRRCGTS